MSDNWKKRLSGSHCSMFGRTAFGSQQRLAQRQCAQHPLHRQYTAIVATALCSWKSSKVAPQAMPSLKCHTQLEPKRCDLPFELRELQTSRVLQMSQGPDLPLRPPKDLDRSRRNMRHVSRLQAAPMGRILL